MMRPSANRHRRARSFNASGCLLVALVVALMCGQSHGQGTMGAVPDPISSRDLSNYGNRLNLSSQQRQALDVYHDQYREEFRQLREGDIEKLMESQRGMQTSPFAVMNDRQRVVDALRDLETVMSKIKAVDNRFFDQVQSVLTEDQIAQMQGVRQARERARYQTGLSRMTTFVNPASRADLTTMVAELELSPDEKIALDPLMAQYEASLTAAARKLHEGASHMVLDALDKLQAQGLDEQAMRDPERRGQMWQAIRPIMSEVYAKLMEKATAVGELNRKNVRSFGQVLSPDNSRSLRDRYYRQAYPEASRGGVESLDRSFKVAQGFDELTDQQHEAIAALAEQFHASADRLTEQMVDLIDENRKTQSFFDFQREAREKFQQSLQELREKREALVKDSLESLRVALGPDLAERMNTRVAEADDDEDDHTEVGLVLGGPGAVAVSVRATAEAQTDELAPDPYLPGPISRRDLELYSARLDFTDDNKVILQSLHDDYQDKFNAIEQREYKAVKDAQTKLRTADPRGGPLPSAGNPEAVDELYRLRKSAIDAVKAVDASFFEDVQASLLDEAQAPKLQRLILARQRAIYNRTIETPDFLGSVRRGGRDGGREGNRDWRDSRAFRAGTDGGDSAEAGIDLAGLVDELKLVPNDPAALDATLLEYEKAATVAFQKSFEAGMTMQQSREKMFAQMARAVGEERGPGGPGGPGGGFRQMMEIEGRAAREARQAVVALNHQTLATLAPAFPEPAAAQLQQAYNKAAFANVYRDPDSAEPQITAALALTDLTDQQRSQVQQVALDFQSAYGQTCEKLIELSIAERRSNTGQSRDEGQQRDWQARQEQRRQREAIYFERDEVCEKALSKLRGILNEDQMNRLGGLKAQASSQ
ncbi:MAG: hypothetical protein L0219_04300 [Phycisphaerales bacterium]|nr:hypothetical protein [Phycisphaerales bacterium]